MLWLRKRTSKCRRRIEMKSIESETNKVGAAELECPLIAVFRTKHERGVVHSVLKAYCT